MRSRTLVIDARWLSTGIGTYTLGALEGASALDEGISVQALCDESDRDRVLHYCDVATTVPARIYSAKEQLLVPWASRNADLLHVPHYNVPIMHSGRLLVSILDLTHLLDRTYRAQWKSRIYAGPMLRLAARRSIHIITLSEYSKLQIVRYLGVPESKVTVIHCGVKRTLIQTDRQVALDKVQSALQLSGRFVLYIGNLKPHKNVSTLVKAFAQLRTRNGWEHQLLIIGDDPRGRTQLLQQVNAFGLQKDVRIVSNIGEELLSVVYAAADLLVLPSFEEGFGLPVIEAMSVGTPVTCSRAASLPEVAGDAALLFDPANPEELAQCIAAVLSSLPMQEQLRAKGLKRAQQFSWEKCALKHSDVYADLLQ